ncbi:hypothetical protein I656_03549 [Geobacillus sp. WSUCF1]|nr:hypothetical protein I656_03549 [Geobacillus sp. WSUCF1]
MFPSSRLAFMGRNDPNEFWAMLMLFIVDAISYNVFIDFLIQLQCACHSPSAVFSITARS